MSLYYSVATSLTDPEIINPFDYQYIDFLSDEQLYQEYLDISEDERKELNFNKCDVMERVDLYGRNRECRTCGNFKDLIDDDGDKFHFNKPQKASHCKICNNCVY